ncbi:capsule biosynthesis GfcC family protein [Vibrio sp. Isolate23]|uniref:capsule biosynthesis GfcC family protein n=1 Tax=Vibrio sp. Isolate23 TaxID=2908533 RepID=UPI001EFCE9F9|nr:capsule biosynthesis GfcC family protein [Vibrio sp. Isolate23]MCG9683974.1 capsule biosynthesis GfcC family protein [Vibrio sp. Isolate23]
MTRGFLFLLTLSSFANAIAANVTVELPSEQIVMDYTAPIRLERALADTIEHSQRNTPFSYPINNALFNLDKQRVANNKKQAALNLIDKLKQQEAELYESLGILREQVKTWQIGYRENLSLDLDFIRLTPSANPMLTGHYQFEYPERPTTITLEGLFFSPTMPEVKPNWTVKDYLSTSRVLSSANNSHAWVIYPDGHYKQVGFAYWNDEKTPLPPGSSIFLGFNNPSKELSQLEQEIVSLIAWRRNY